MYIFETFCQNVSELYKHIAICELCISDSKNKILRYSRPHGTRSGGEAAHVKDVDLRGKGKFTLEQAMKAQKGSRWIALIFL